MNADEDLMGHLSFIGDVKRGISQQITHLYETFWSLFRKK